MDVDEHDPEWEVPAVQSVDDFELAKAVKEKNRPTGKYESLEGTSTLKAFLVNWETVFIQFRDSQGESTNLRTKTSWATRILYLTLPNILLPTLLFKPSSCFRKSATG